MRYLKKSDWGDYWATNEKMSHEQLIERSFEVLSKSNIRLFSDKNCKNVMDYLFPSINEETLNLRMVNRD